MNLKIENIAHQQKHSAKRIKYWVRNFTKNLLESVAYHKYRRCLSGPKIDRVLFICKGNICRSAFSELYLKSKLINTPFKVQSCGLQANSGLASPPEAVLAAKEFDIDLGLHRSKNLADIKVDANDLIVAMEYRQALELIKKYPAYAFNIRLMREFAPFPESILCNIYDPYGKDSTVFQAIFKQISRSADRLAMRLIGSRLSD